MTIKLSDHFTYGKLFRFVLPSICMMVFTSIYGVVDGFYVSNFVGKTPFAALNLIYPLIQVVASLGFMMGAGGSAVIGKTLGERKNGLARKYFSMLVYATLIISVVASGVMIPTLRDAAYLMGADDSMIEYCVTYGTILLIGLPLFMLQNFFQSLLVTAEKPNLGFIITVAAGCTNMVLDYLLVGKMNLGLAGAAWATNISQVVGGVFPFIYFIKANGSRLRMVKTKFYGKILLKTCTNGSSELVSNISASIVSIFYNKQLMEYVGEDGVAAFGVFMYVSFIFVAIFIGYSMGSAPIISYHYGAENHSELKNLFKKGLVIIVITEIAMFVLGELTAMPVSVLFVAYDEKLLEITAKCFYIGSISYLTTGINIFASGFFTALNNGVISAFISFMRTLVFQIATVMILPIFFGVDGIWWSITAADVLAFIVTVICLIKYRKRYHYA